MSTVREKVGLIIIWLFSTTIQLISKLVGAVTEKNCVALVVILIKLGVIVSGLWALSMLFLYLAVKTVDESLHMLLDTF